MHKYEAHGATDVTGFGILGHANNLASVQKEEVAFVIHNLPIIAKMAAVSKACGGMFGLLQGRSAETSGKSVCLPGRRFSHIMHSGNVLTHFIAIILNKVTFEDLRGTRHYLLSTHIPKVGQYSHQKRQFAQGRHLTSTTICYVIKLHEQRYETLLFIFASENIQ